MGDQNGQIMDGIHGGYLDFLQPGFSSHLELPHDYLLGQVTRIVSYPG
jgi:hypothetical protein